MESKFTGDLWGMIGVNLLSALISIITLGIGAPWAVCMRIKWYTKHTIVDGKRLVFDGRGVQLFGYCLVWLLLLMIPSGLTIYAIQSNLDLNLFIWISASFWFIYSLYLPIKFQQWGVKHTHAQSVNNRYWQNNAGYSGGEGYPYHGPENYRGPEYNHSPENYRGPEYYHGPEYYRGPENYRGPSNYRGYGNRRPGRSRRYYD